MNEEFKKLNKILNSIEIKPRIYKIDLSKNDDVNDNDLVATNDG